jgi:1,4-alpha-glucan branching enzyme
MGSTSQPMVVQGVTQAHIDSATPFGVTLISGGATFRVWAPEATAVYLVTDELSASRLPDWEPRPEDVLVKQADDSWTGFLPGVADGTRYLYYVIGAGSRGLKRDPYARELSTDPPFPDCDCIVRDPDSYPWHDAGFRPPPFHELTIYQLHVGVFYGTDSQGQDSRKNVAKFLDVVDRIPYLRKLGVNAVQLLPIQEFPYDNSLGYNNLDYFSPEMAYQVQDPTELPRYLNGINALLSEKREQPLAEAEITPGPNQLKALVDLLHLNGIAVIFDLVYNHAGGGFDDQSIYFFDRQIFRTNNDSLYFIDKGWAGGLIFAYWNEGVRQFLIRNAKFFLREYHIDGMRYDEVSVMDDHGGWFFCQELAAEAGREKPQAIQIAEYWSPSRELAVVPPPRGMGFDAALSDRLRDAVRGAVGEAAQGAPAYVNLDPVRDALYPPYGFPDAWRAVHCLENHDIVYAGRPPEELKPRLAKLAGGDNARSWYARSRSRFATSILLTAPGIPMLFMGQEILEDKNWSDNPRHFRDSLIWWDGLEQDRVMADFLEFTKAALTLRSSLPAVRGPNMNAYHVNNGSRVIAFHRWHEGGGDVVVAGSLSESNLYDYEIGMPRNGQWREVFNSDYFDGYPNPVPAGNFGAVVASGPPMHGFSASARITIPANGVIVLTK